MIRDLEAQHNQARRSLRCRRDRAEGTYAPQRGRRGSHVSALWFVDQAETLVVADSLGRDAAECRHLAGGHFDASAEESLECLSNSGSAVRRESEAAAVACRAPVEVRPFN
jgi:hypothetical protein